MPVWLQATFVALAVGKLQAARGQARACQADVLAHQFDGRAHILLSFSALSDKKCGVHSLTKKTRHGHDHDQADGGGNQQFQKAESALRVVSRHLHG